MASTKQTTYGITQDTDVDCLNLEMKDEIQQDRDIYINNTYWNNMELYTTKYMDRKRMNYKKPHGTNLLHNMTRD